jgi:hypothetical protein
MARPRPGDAGMLTGPNGVQVKNPYGEDHYQLCCQMIDAGAQAEALFGLLEQAGVNITDMRDEARAYVAQAQGIKGQFFPMRS